LLLEKSGGGDVQPVGRVVLFDLDVPAVCSNFVARMPVAPGNDSRFLCFLHEALYSLRLNRRSIKQNTGIQNLDSSSYLSEKAAVPPFSTQHRIAEFLDRETAKIDALIAKKQLLAKLLGEHERSAAEELLATVGSRGIALKYVVDILPGFAFPSERFIHSASEGIRLLRGVNVSSGGLRWRDVVFWPVSEALAFAMYQLQIGDLVFGMDRPWVSEGPRVAEVTDKDVPSLLLQRVARLRARNGLRQGYLRLLLRSKRFQAYFEPVLTGVSVPHISPEQIGNIRFELPSDTVQVAVYGQVTEQTAATQRKRKAIDKSIEVLREYRSALITAAVTGQIDVRHRVA
jgi:type I restriction enzyme S subunit